MNHEPIENNADCTFMPCGVTKGKAGMLNSQSDFVNVFLREHTFDQIAVKKTASSLSQVVSKGSKISHCQQKTNKHKQASFYRRRDKNVEKPERQVRQLHQRPEETPLPGIIAQLKSELANIVSEVELREAYLQGLQDERDQMKFELNQARAEENEATSIAQQVEKEIVNLRKDLRQNNEQIPLLRKKIEKRYCEYFSNAEKLFLLRKELYRKSQDPFSDKHKRVERLHEVNLKDWSIIYDTEFLEDKPRDEVNINTPEYQRIQWKNQTDWRSVSTIFRSSAILNNGFSDSSQETERCC
uniref:Uncharacterized protein n=1 Tax=Ditylum brightwellii TaxID=49249 RepID=A0A7S4SSC1_9STRA